MIALWASGYINTNKYETVLQTSVLWGLVQQIWTTRRPLSIVFTFNSTTGAPLSGGAKYPTTHKIQYLITAGMDLQKKKKKIENKGCLSFLFATWYSGSFLHLAAPLPYIFNFVCSNMMTLYVNFIQTSLCPGTVTLKSRNWHSIIYLLTISLSCVVNQIGSRAEKLLMTHNHLSGLKISVLAY